MRKFLIVTTILLLAFMSACSSTANATTASTEAATVAPVNTQASATTGSLSTDYTDAATVEQQLLLGSLKLEGSDNAITTDQASQLLTLWSSLQTFGPGMGNGGPQQSGNGDAQSTQQAPATESTSTVDTDSVLAQIQAILTTAQIQAIASMQVTNASIDTYISDNNLSMQPGNGGGSQGNGQNGSNTPSDNNGTQPQGTPPADNGSGQQPQGNPPSDSGNGQPDGTMTAPGNGQQPDRTTNVLLNAVIQLLQQKTGTTSTQPAAMNGGQINGGDAADGNSNSGIGPGGNGSSSSTEANITSAYTVDGQTLSEDSQTYTASNADESAVLVKNGGNLTITNGTFTSSGDTSSTDNSSFYGQNAVALAQENSSLSISNSTISSTGLGANGAFATGSNSLVSLSSVTIHATGDGGHAVMATQGGSVTLDNVTMTTSGGSSSAVATDRGGGTITVKGGTITTSGNNSAALYSTGSIAVADATLQANGAEAAVIEGSNSITLNDSSLISTFAGKWGVMIYQSFSGDAKGSEGTFTMTGGTLSYTSTTGPLFYITNSTGNINLKNVAVSAASGTLLRAEGNDQWGTSGSNGGNAVLVADSQTLSGDFSADKLSTLALTLQNNSALSGAINADATAKTVTLTLDAASTWTVTADSTLTTLNDSDGISGTSISNIIGNGHTVYYDSSANPALNGQTYALSGGGTLTPAQ